MHLAGDSVQGSGTSSSHRSDAARHQLACDPGSQSPKTRRGLAFGERGDPHPHAQSRLAAFFLRSSDLACPRSRTASWCLTASLHVTKHRNQFSQKSARDCDEPAGRRRAHAGTDVTLCCCCSEANPCAGRQCLRVAYGRNGLSLTNWFLRNQRK